MKNHNFKMSNKTQKPIEEPWALYQPLWKKFLIGRVVRESKIGLYVQESENQLFLRKIWLPSDVERFSSFSQAVQFYGEIHRDTTMEDELTKKILTDFPTTVRNECLQQMHDILSVYSQSQPSCTPTVGEDWGPFGKHPNLKDGPIGPHPNIKY